MATTERTDHGVNELLSALDKCFEEPVIHQVSWKSAVRPAVVKLIAGIRESEQRATVGRIRDRIKFARIGGTEWREVYAPQMDWLLNDELERKEVR